MSQILIAVCLSITSTEPRAVAAPPAPSPLVAQGKRAACAAARFLQERATVPTRQPSWQRMHLTWSTD